MSSSRLCLNSSKTQLIWLGASRYVQLCLTSPLDIAGVYIRPLCDLGVILDSELSLVAHVSHITSVCYFQIHQIRLLHRSLSFEAAHVLVCALVHSRLDYCNAVLANTPQSLLAPLQSVLRSAARAVLRCLHRAGLMRLIRERLHWLPVPDRITFKLATLDYKCISGRAPDYLVRLCTDVESVEARARLCSVTDGKLLLPTTDTVTVDRRGFYYACPATWNSLPPHLTDISMSLFSFRHGMYFTFFN